jgi:hypothetical protein
MQYMKLDAMERDAMLAALGGMANFLDDAFSRLNAEQASRPGADDGFSPVEQVWHLADLEREGFAVRIDRLARGGSPHLPDFDGTAIARARNYRALSLADGIASFRAARAGNIAVLRGIASAEVWARSGTQDGVGTVSLCDMPAFMSQHDAAHRAEIEAWKLHAAAAAGASASTPDPKP